KLEPLPRVRNHPAHVRASYRAAAERVLGSEQSAQIVGETLHDATLVELLDITPTVGAVDPEPLSIVRQRVQKRRQFLRPARRNVNAEISLGQRKGQLAFGCGDGHDRLRFREESQKFTGEK